jgi:hypothetical protein
VLPLCAKYSKYSVAVHRAVICQCIRKVKVTGLQNYRLAFLVSASIVKSVGYRSKPVIQLYRDLDY